MQPQMQPQDIPKECGHCQAQFNPQFNLARSRYHCRVCDRDYCSKCVEVEDTKNPNLPRCVCVECIEKKPVWSGKSVHSCDCEVVAGLSNQTRTNIRGVLYVRIIEAKGLTAADMNLVSKASSDPYCILQVDDGEPVKTKTDLGTLDPYWDVDACFHVGGSHSILKINVFDYDFGRADDPLGDLSLHVGDLKVNSREKGWFKLNPPCPPYDQPVGGIHLELLMLEENRWNHLMSCISPPVEVPPPPPLDIDHIYQSAMHIWDLAYTRSIGWFLFEFLDILYWEHPKKTVIALVVWNITATFSSHWFTILCILLVIYMLQQRALKDINDASGHHSQLNRLMTMTLSGPAARPAVERVQPTDDKWEEQSLGGVVSHLALMSPSWLKETISSLQPTARVGAETLHWIRAVFCWQAPESAVVAFSLILCAGFTEWASSATSLRVFGSAILVCMVAPQTLAGFIHHASWRFKSKAPLAVTVHSHYRDEWTSEEKSFGLTSYLTNGNLENVVSLPAERARGMFGQAGCMRGVSKAIQERLSTARSSRHASTF